MSAPDYDLAPDRVLERLAAILFEVGSTPALYAAWEDGSLGEGFRARPASALSIGATQHPGT